VRYVRVTYVAMVTEESPLAAWLDDGDTEEDIQRYAEEQAGEAIATLTGPIMTHVEIVERPDEESA
jgi:hypothetical protein